MTHNFKIAECFEYCLEDTNCEYCLFTQRKSKKYKNGCREETCRFEDIRREAVKNGRMKRSK